MSNNLKRIGEEKGFTIEDLSELTGLSCEYICHLEKDSRANPTLNTVKKIAKVLNKSIDEIF